MFKEKLSATPVVRNEELEKSLAEIYENEHNAKHKLWKDLIKIGISPDMICPKKNRPYSTFSLTELYELLKTIELEKETV
jgi:hypothetical protein